ncbi:YggS family pyridoxal phosphate-dependent enzyme [Thalassotalea sp. LPB0316]|uniref:YggS family pyridoxal phosphate-dependent enzyme n=1 Tax=Thalassotalea sp. LPB0316 TaxID=2769490 RepID=UPI0018688370|nr:YggS family pyridoxal phosphate-dependent enzyme [Thalassotalea sp. LPB0316]QOL25695.1 YggS family pyridoxal phosphate-dependent enzyme [Thalassotalea sp. LPB0316]
MSNIKDNLGKVEQQIKNACQLTNKSPTSVQLLAVSKTKPASDVALAYQAGQRLFGENYVQEGVDKIAELQALTDIQWHFIGPIQSNKTKLIAEHFDWVQSVDRVKILTRLNEQRPKHLGKLNICLQINISGEASKSGATIEQVPELIEALSSCDNLNFRGFMAIPEKGDATLSFEKMDQLFKHYQALWPTVDTLSMGMSDDMESAIANGSTMVRIGTAIFGARN